VSSRERDCAPCVIPSERYGAPCVIPSERYGAPCVIPSERYGAPCVIPSERLSSSRGISCECEIPPLAPALPGLGRDDKKKAVPGLVAMIESGVIPRALRCPLCHPERAFII